MEQTRDIFFMVAAKFIITNKTVSITALQKDLKIDCNRAESIISELEEAGLIGPQKGEEPRKVLFDNMLSFVKSLPRQEEEIKEHEWILHLDYFCPAQIYYYFVTVPAAPSCREQRRFIPSRKNGKDEKETRNSPGQKTWPQISIC